jgi:hypothetical protein
VAFARRLAVPLKDLGDDLHVAEDGLTFALTVPAPDFLPECDPNSRCVCNFILAPDASAARRALRNDIEGDRGLSLTRVPASLPPGAVMAYTQLLEVTKREHPAVECFGSYRIGTDGKFLYSTITRGGFWYLFRSNSPDDTDFFAVLFLVPLSASHRASFASPT